MKYSVIDIGSNSVRLMLDGTNPVNRKLLKSTQLAKGMKNGLLDVAQIDKTACAISYFCDLARAEGYETMIFATEAVRSAKNANLLTDKVFLMTGKHIDIIDGKTEAKIGFMGACGNSGHKCILDVGGASSELAAGKNGELYYSESLPIGVVRLKDKFGTDWENLTKYLEENVTKYQKIACDEYIAISGTATSLSAMNHKMTVYDPSRIHNSFLSVDYLDEIITELKNKTTEQIAHDYPVLGEKRASVILCGAIIMRTIANYLAINGFKVSDRDNTEGYLIYKNLI